ncbi:MAG: universal stress protein [Burkholderiales bacterium]|nr:MAG: universal stress protein [Burkholderiales bacterium]
MTYKTILVHLDDSKQIDRRIDAATELAVACDAHLVGVFVPPPVYVPAFPEASVRDLILERRRQEDERAGKAVLGRFDDVAHKAGLSGVEGRIASGEPREALTLHSRYADLVVMGQAEDGTPGARDAVLLAEDVILTCGRPVLMVPYIGLQEPVGRRILIAWDASREATRAVTDSLPLLERANKVTVVTVDARPSEQGHGDLPGADLALFLSRHGINVEAVHVSSGGIGVGETLLNQASDRDGDLIVMGCYAHSRMRELVLGGATRTLLHSMPVPLLMSH